MPPRQARGQPLHPICTRPAPRIQPLGKLPGGRASEAVAINEAGEVVGTAGTPRGPRAFRWTPGGGMQDLNTLVRAGAGLVLAEALGINELGMILAIGYEHHATEAHAGGEQRPPHAVAPSRPTTEVTRRRRGSSQQSDESASSCVS